MADHVTVTHIVHGTAVMLFGEGGFQDNALWSAGLRTSLCHNQLIYWGTGGSC